MTDSPASASTTPSPRQVVEQFLRRSADNELDKLVELYSDDALIEIPFVPVPGAPAYRSQGREVHRARFKAGVGLLRFEKVDAVVIHETADPEVVIVEFDLHGQAVETSRPFTFSYIMVMRIKDGLIVSSRDYGHPLASAQALGKLPQLLATVGQEAG